MPATYGAFTAALPYFTIFPLFLIQAVFTVNPISNFPFSINTVVHVDPPVFRVQQAGGEPAGCILYDYFEIESMITALIR